MAEVISIFKALDDLVDTVQREGSEENHGHTPGSLPIFFELQRIS